MCFGKLFSGGPNCPEPLASIRALSLSLAFSRCPWRVCKDLKNIRNFYEWRVRNKHCQVKNYVRWIRNLEPDIKSFRRSWCARLLSQTATYSGYHVCMPDLVLMRACSIATVGYR